MFTSTRNKRLARAVIGYAAAAWLLAQLADLVLDAFDSPNWVMQLILTVLVIGLPLVQVVRHRPEAYGEVPDGQLPDDHIQSESGGSHTLGPDFTARQAMRTPAFWLISSGHALALLTVSSVMVHLIAHLTEGLNYSVAQAGGVVALLTGFQLLGQLSGGYLGDRINKRLICAACMVAHAAGLLIVTYATSFAMVLAFTVLHGLAWGTRGPLMVALRADYFGARSFGTIMGFSSLIVMLGMSSGPVFAGIMADIYGNYEVGLSVLAGLSLLGSLCFAFARAPRLPQLTPAVAS